MGALTLIEEKNNYVKGDAGYELIQKIQEGNEVQDIYVYDGSDSADHQIYYTYQFLNRSVNIIPELPENTLEEVLLFSNKDLAEILNGTYYWAQLDDNEYVYCSGEDYRQWIEECGIEMWRLK